VYLEVWSGTVQLVVIVHTSLHPKQHIDRLSLFLQGSPVCETRRHTDTDYGTWDTSVSICHIYATHAVRPKNRFAHNMRAAGNSPRRKSRQRKERVCGVSESLLITITSAISRIGRRLYGPFDWRWPSCGGHCFRTSPGGWDRRRDRWGNRRCVRSRSTPRTTAGTRRNTRSLLTRPTHHSVPYGDTRYKIR